MLGFPVSVGLALIISNEAEEYAARATAELMKGADGSIVKAREYAAKSKAFSSVMYVIQSAVKGRKDGE